MVASLAKGFNAEAITVDQGRRAANADKSYVPDNDRLILCDDQMLLVESRQADGPRKTSSTSTTATMRGDRRSHHADAQDLSVDLDLDEPFIDHLAKTKMTV